MVRREFLKGLAGTGLSLCSGTIPCGRGIPSPGIAPNLSRVEARYYKKLPDREIECTLCPRQCKLGDKERGYCGVRENDGGTYFTLVYGKACAANVDPIEKKPFYHFLPGTDAFSLATAGCNVNCKFCQNWQMSQARAEQVEHFDFPPHAVVAAAEKYNCPSIAYTYTEPVVFFEYVYDTSLEAAKRKIKNCVVTGGHINAEPLRDLLEVVDAVKIDLKSFQQDFYTRYVRGELQPVLEAIKSVHRTRVWLEIVYLVIPTLNDQDEDIRRMSRWLRQEIGSDVPLHFTRFHPMYLIKNLPPTPVSTLERLRGIGLEEGLHYVYLGNVPGHEGENTFCAGCGRPIVERFGLRLKSIKIKRGVCEFCGRPVPGIWA